MSRVAALSVSPEDFSFTRITYLILKELLKANPGIFLGGGGRTNYRHAGLIARVLGQNLCLNALVFVFSDQ